MRPGLAAITTGAPPGVPGSRTLAWLAPCGTCAGCSGPAAVPSGADFSVGRLVVWGMISSLRQGTETPRPPRI